MASGHVGGFSDPLMDCKACKTRHRADKLIEDYAAENQLDINPVGWSNEQMADYIQKTGIACPACGAKDFTDIRKFNLMFKTYQGVTEDSSSELYLRPETAQGIFVNFKNIARTTRKKLPFGVGQIGKSFRNEITPGNFIFRIREFEQMELEFFCKPGTDLEWFKFWKDYCAQFLYDLGMTKENLKLRDHDADELCFYSKATTDFEYLFPFGWGELWGIADRTDYDLSQHANHSGESMEYFDPETNEKYVPYVIEPSLGADRVALAFLVDAYDEEVVGEGIPALFCVCIRRSRPSRRQCFLCLKSCLKKHWKYRRRFQNTLWSILTNPGLLASATVGRMRSVRRFASRTTSIPLKMDA